MALLGLSLREGKIMRKELIALLGAGAVLAACTTDPYTGAPKVANTTIGTGLGAAVGAAAGYLYADAKDKTGSSKRKAILVGAGIGALSGGGVGLYMDKQEAELRQQLQGTGVSVTRNGDQIILNMPSNVTFGSDQSAIQSQFYPVLNSVALVVKKYNQTLIDVKGHTDSSGDFDYNQRLSEQRALSVANYLSQQGQIDGRRFAVAGFGETQPVADNTTEAGKAQNRRVEIQLAPLT